MIGKLHIVNGRKILALCDNNIIGRKYSEKKMQLDLSSSFYNGTQISEEDLLKIVKDIYTINAVGEKSVNFLTKLKIISNKNVGRIKKIPYAFVILE